MRQLKDNNKASAVPLILFAVTIVGCGALYTLLITTIGLPIFNDYIPVGDPKTFILMCIYAIPIFLIVIGGIALVKSGMKQNFNYDGGGPY